MTLPLRAAQETNAARVDAACLAEDLARTVVQIEVARLSGSVFDSRLQLPDLRDLHQVSDRLTHTQS